MCPLSCCVFSSSASVDSTERPTPADMKVPGIGRVEEVRDLGAAFKSFAWGIFSVLLLTPCIGSLVVRSLGLLPSEPNLPLRPDLTSLPPPQGLLLPSKGALSWSHHPGVHACSSQQQRVPHHPGRRKPCLVRTAGGHVPLTERLHDSFPITGPPHLP